MNKEPKIIVFGAGAIGGSVAGWIGANYPEIYVLDTPNIANTIRENGITLYLGDTPTQRENVRVKVIDDLSEVQNPDIIVVAVKNYSLDAVAKSILAKVGNSPMIVALQNGIENQEILPKYFKKVIYGVVSYNAWLDSPGVIGYQKKGPLVLGILDLSLKPDLDQVAEIFNRGVETIATPHFQDAAHSKMIINLSNSITTLVGHQVKAISDPSIFQKLLTNLLYEGVEIMRSAGYKECRLGGMPSWITIKIAAKFPQWITRPLFKKNVKKMVMSSMAQDILQRGGTESELESINGYFIKLANQNHLKAPYNRTVYELCKERFGKPGFQPMDVKEVWARIEPIL